MENRYMLDGVMNPLYTIGQLLWSRIKIVLIPNTGKEDRIHYFVGL
jgi:hypothetical protein